MSFDIYANVSTRWNFVPSVQEESIDSSLHHGEHTMMLTPTIVC